MGLTARDSLWDSEFLGSGIPLLSDGKFCAMTEVPPQFEQDHFGPCVTKKF